MKKSFTINVKDVVTESKVMRWDWEKNELVEIEGVTLEIGQRVIGFLGYGGSESGTFYCISEPDERGNQKLVEEGYRHRYLNWTVGSDDRPLSKKFGIGLYWDDVNDPDYRKPQVELDELCRQADEQIRKNEEYAEYVTWWKGNRKIEYVGWTDKGISAIVQELGLNEIQK